MKAVFFNSSRLVKWFLPFYLLTFLPLHAQVGTWENYLAYHELQNICAASNNQLFVLASNSLYQYNQNDESITTYDKVTGLNDTYITHIAWNPKVQKLIAVYQNSNIDLIDIKGNVTNISDLYTKIMTESKTVNRLIIDNIYVWLDCDFGYVKVNMQKAEITDTYWPNNPDYPKYLPSYDEYKDLETYRPVVEKLNPIGPKYNHFYESTFLNGKLYTTGGYFLSGMNDYNYPGTIQVYDGNDWMIYEDNLSEKTGYPYLDINCISVDPTDETHVYAGGRCGLYEFKDGQLLNYYNKDNSPLRPAIDRGTELGNDYVLINGIQFDQAGNLVVLNSQARGVNMLVLSKDHTWTSYHQELLDNSDGISLSGLRSMFFDSRGLLWFVNTSWMDQSVCCYNPSTDKLFKYSNWVNQDGISYSLTFVNSVCEDKEKNIWVGTNLGPFMIKSDEVGQEDVTFYQIKVPRNDGTDYADYLLYGVNISHIAIDGGNRKWFATNGAGAFLISADNIQQIANFKEDNSYLLSNTISSTAINPKTGKVYFLTDKGLCSYQGDATEPSEEMTKDNVYAYPNPVTPDYTGLITITGLTYDADVKITASNGALIAQGRSNGGMFTWDGNDRQGRRVASGIYFVITATSEGKSGTVCKIAIIN
jgi:hypothetical protein